MQIYPKRLALGLAIVLLPLGSAATAQEADSASLTLGRQLFTEGAEPACALCHTLADAGSTAEIGPILDQLKPDADRTRNAVKNGIGVMPAYEGSLTAAEIEAVSVYVSRASRSAD